MPKVSCMQNFKFLACKEVLCLLQVFDVSLKEAQGMFLIPARMEFEIFFIFNYLFMSQGSYVQNLKFLACQEVARLLHVFDASLKEAKGMFLTPARITLKYFSSLMIYLCLKEATCKI